MTRQTALYRHFDSDGALLYVGISLSAIQRLSQHAQESHWSTQIAKVTVQWFDDREDAERFERLAIWYEKPKHNKAHTQQPSLDRRRYAVQHDESGRLDGWYPNENEAREILTFFRENYSKFGTFSLRHADLAFPLADSKTLRGWMFLSGEVLNPKLAA